MQRLSYVPITINANQIQQSQQQQIDQIYGISLLQPNTYRNISIPRRRSTQYSMHDDRRKSVDLQSYQYKNPFPPTLQQQQGFIQPQQQPQIYQAQHYDSSMSQLPQNKSYYSSIQNQVYENVNPQMVVQNNKVPQIVTYLNNQANQNQQLQAQPVQQLPISSVQQHQYGSSLLNYNIIPASSNKYSESEKQQIAKIAAKYRELKQINTKIMNKRHSIDSTSLQADPQNSVNNFYQRNTNGAPCVSNYAGVASSDLGGQGSLIQRYNQGGNTLRQSIPTSSKESDIFQNYNDRILNVSMNGSFINQYNDPNTKINSSLNTSITNDTYLSKPRSFSQATRGDVQNQQPQIIYDQRISPAYQKTYQSIPIPNQKKLGENTPVTHENQTDITLQQRGVQNLKILQTNMNHQNLQRQAYTPLQVNQGNSIDEKNNQITTDQQHYLSETMKNNANNYKRQNIEGNPHFQSILQAHQIRRGFSNNPIHIQSVELLLSAEKKQNQQENEQGTQLNTASFNINEQKSNQTQKQKQINEDKENIVMRPQHTFTNNSSVVIEYNEVYKQDRIPISHVKMTQSKLVCDYHNSSIQNKLNNLANKDNKQPDTSKITKNISDVKNLIDQQVKQIQQECQARSKQKLNNQKEQIEEENKNITKGYYFVENNVISHTNLQKNDKTLSLNGTKINQNMDTSFNCSDLLQLSLSNLGTPITVKYQSNQQQEQKDPIQVFNYYQPSDRSSSQGTQRQSQECENKNFEINSVQEYKQNEEIPKSSRSSNQLPTPPPSDPNIKTSFYHKKNICKIAEAFTFNTNLSSIQTQSSIEQSNNYNNNNNNNSNVNQDPPARKTCFNTPLISRSSIEEIRKNQQQILEKNEEQSPSLVQKENSNVCLNQGNNQIQSIEDLEKSHQNFVSLRQQYQQQNGIQNIAKICQTIKNNQKEQDIKEVMQEDSILIPDQAEINKQNQTASEISTQREYFKNQNISVTSVNQNILPINKQEIEQKVLFNSNKNLLITQSQTFSTCNLQQQKDNDIQTELQQDMKTEKKLVRVKTFEIDERLTEEFADALYWQLNIERSLLQLKSGLSRKITEIEYILPEQKQANNENTEELMKGESLLTYRDRLNKILCTSYTDQELEIIFQNSKENQSNEIFIKKEDVLEVLLGTQSLTITSKAQEISEEAKKITRNIIKETLRAQLNFKEIKLKFKQYENELFLHISNGNKDLITYSDFKSFLIKNGYQVRDQEMMLLIYRFHKPNSIRLNLQQFQFVI